MQSGQIVKAPTFVGDDSTEGASFAPNATSNAEVLWFLEDDYPGLTQRDLRKINASYPLAPMSQCGSVQRLMHMASLQRISDRRKQC